MDVSPNVSANVGTRHISSSLGYLKLHLLFIKIMEFRIMNSHSNTATGVSTVTMMESSQSSIISTLWHWRIGLFTCQNWLQSSHITSGWQSVHLNWDFLTPHMKHVESFPVIQIGDKVLSVVYATVHTFPWYFSAVQDPCSFHKLVTPNLLLYNTCRLALTNHTCTSTM